MNGLRSILALVAALIAAGGVALFSVFHDRIAAPKVSGQKPAGCRVAWRVPVGAREEALCAVSDGWVVAGAEGGLLKVTREGSVQWRVSFSNETFTGVAVAADGRVAAATQSGRVYGLDGATGTTLWCRVTDARFQRAPQMGTREGEIALWLIAQEDGRLFCLRATDGAVVWVTEPTNRCDGEPVVWGRRVAFGNCDGAVYVVDAIDGKALGAIAVGEEDQMAGGILALADGRLVTGTRQGNLVVIDPEKRACEAKVKVSESEAFVTPVLVADGVIAMGTEEGGVTLWRRTPGGALAPGGRFEAGAAVTSLASFGDRLFALAGGTLFVLDSSGRPLQRLVIGDDAGRLAVDSAGDLACLADGALVHVKGGGR